MSSQGSRLVDHLRRRMGRRLSHTRGTAPQLQDRVLSEFDRKVRDDCAPNDIRVLLHPNTYARLAPTIPALRAEVIKACDERCNAAGYRTPRRRTVTFVPDATLPMNTQRIVVGFTYDPGAFANDG
jgi:hypothetical protein